jgi:hypothetical protein
MDAAIAKLEAEQTLGKKPAAPEPKPAPVVQAAPMVAAAPEEEIPEIDDDLVVPDEEEPVNKKKVPGKIVEEVSKKSKRREDEESEAEEPRAKKKKRLEEEEVEEPKVKKKKSRASDEEDEEEPPAKIKKGREEEDGAFSDKPQTTAKKSRVEDDENEEEDEVEEEPRRGKKKKKAGSPMLLVLLISGGILGLFACCGCGIGGYFMFASNSLVGKWEGDLFVVKVQFDFHRGGTGTLSFKAPDGAGMGGKAEEATMHFNYKVSGSNPMILEIEPTKIDSKDGKVRFDQRDVGGRLRVTMEGDTMTLVELEPRGGVAVPLKLRRVR